MGCGSGKLVVELPVQPKVHIPSLDVGVNSPVILSPSVRRVPGEGIRRASSKSVISAAVDSRRGSDGIHGFEPSPSGNHVSMLDQWEESGVDWEVVGHHLKDGATGLDVLQSPRDLLGDNAFVAQFDKQTQRRLLAKMRTETFQPNQTIVKQGEKGDSMYIIIFGEVVVTKETHGVTNVLTHLYRGHHFGELALIYGNERVATVRSRGESTCMTLKKSDLDTFPEVRLFLLVKKIPLLATLSQEDRMTVVQHLQPEEFKDGQDIVKQGTPGDKFCIITSGEALVLDQSESAERLLTKLYEGAFFGEISLIENTPRTATVRAMGTTQCMSMTKAAFQGCVASTGFADIVRERYNRTLITRQQRSELKRASSSLAAAAACILRQPKTKESQVVVKNKADGLPVINNYKILRTLGNGSYGKVSLVQYMGNHELFAMKVVQKDKAAKAASRAKLVGAASSEVLADLKNEVEIMKRMSHPNIVRLVEVIDDPSADKMYLIQEYAEKGEIGSNTKISAPLPPDLARKYLRDILRGVEYLHLMGIVHRDIKPANLLVTKDDTVKIADFGVARAIAEGSATAVPKGTPAFMAPELLALAGPAPLDPRVDVWSVGATLYMLVVGQPPWMAPTWPELARMVVQNELTFPEKCSVGATKLEPALRNLLVRILCKNPAKRLSLPEVMGHEWVSNEGTEIMAPVTQEAFVAALRKAERESEADKHAWKQGNTSDLYEKSSDDEDEDLLADSDEECVAVDGDEDLMAHLARPSATPSPMPRGVSSSRTSPSQNGVLAAMPHLVLPASFRLDGGEGDDWLRPLPVGKGGPCDKLRVSDGGGENLALAIRFGNAVRQGPRKYMEDRAVAVGDLSDDLLLTRGMILPGQQAFFGIYDGHSGASAAIALQQEFHVALAAAIAENTEDQEADALTPIKFDAAECFQTAATKMDDKLLEQDRIREDQRRATGTLFRTKTVGSTQWEHSSGSTAAVLLVQSNIMHAAWVGDSRAVLCRGGIAIPLTEDHTTNSEAEKKRLLAMGAELIRGRLFGDLKVSRAFGDRRHKLTGCLTCEMEVKSLAITPQDEFVVIASDGVWDVLTSQAAVNFVRNGLRSLNDVQRVAEALLVKADDIGSVDNLSALVVAFHQRAVADPLIPPVLATPRVPNSTPRPVAGSNAPRFWPRDDIALTPTSAARAAERTS
mmetsp:Transcript_9485/g.21709  ORF Transcript_9485/g.21709 Transcript_9485/m.21709 type:complete len:1183 (+) Transcript_9485:42-3590(+)